MGIFATCRNDKPAFQYNPGSQGIDFASSSSFRLGIRRALILRSWWEKVRCLHSQLTNAAAPISGQHPVPTEVNNVCTCLLLFSLLMSEQHFCRVIKSSKVKSIGSKMYHLINKHTFGTEILQMYWAALETFKVAAPTTRKTHLLPKFYISHPIYMIYMNTIIINKQLGMQS